MNNSLNELLSELLKDGTAKEKLNALCEKSTDAQKLSAATDCEKALSIDKKISILSSLSETLGEDFSLKAQKVIKVLKAIKIIFDSENAD